MLTNEAVRDVTEATWETEVIQRSYQTPIVVDFWAPWCGPCRVLGPILERLAGEAEGAWTLAKLNVDSASNLSAQYGIQGIPAVKAFKNGKVVAQFVGAQPESGVRRWLSTLAPTEAERLLDQAAALEAKGDWQGAANVYRQILAATPDDPPATLVLGRSLLRAGQEAEAVPTLERVADHIDYGAQARALLGQARLTVEAREIGGEAGARARLAEAPNDPEALYGLAAALATTGDYRGALDNLLSIVRRNRHWHNDLARETMIELFDLLGDDNPLTREYRIKLAQTLF
jgi:putative thioredoxin